MKEKIFTKDRVINAIQKEKRSFVWSIAIAGVTSALHVMQMLYTK